MWAKAMWDHNPEAVTERIPPRPSAAHVPVASATTALPRTAGLRQAVIGFRTVIGLAPKKAAIGSYCSFYCRLRVRQATYLEFSSLVEPKYVRPR